MRTIKVVGKVGAKGELYPTKEVRELVGLKPGEKVLYVAKEGKLEVLPLKKLFDCYDEEDLVKISLEEFEKLTEEILGE